MADYYNKGLDMTFSLYENKIMYNEGSGSVTAKRECTEYWFNQQNEIGSLEEISQISYIVSGSNSYIKDNGWSNISHIAFTESDVINLWFPSDNTKTISDVVNGVMTPNSFDEPTAIGLIKDTNHLVTDWSI